MVHQLELQWRQRLVSALTSRPIRKEVGMTGEITLTWTSTSDWRLKGKIIRSTSSWAYDIDYSKR